jgi:hypothetical protein
MGFHQHKPFKQQNIFMRILVTGTTGLVGRNLLPLLKNNVAYKLPEWVPGDILVDSYVKKYLEKFLSLEDSKSKNSLFKP